MARPRGFDRNKALRKAMLLFWKQGYEATSVHDLCTQLELNPGSLYNTFHDKHALFLESLDCYAATEGQQMCALLGAPGAGRAAIEQLFRNAVDASMNDPDTKGCLMVNTAAELAAHDPQVRAKVIANQATMEQALCQVILHAQHVGGINPQHNPYALARFLASSMNGLRVTAKITSDRSTLQQIVATTLRALD